MLQVRGVKIDPFHQQLCRLVDNSLNQSSANPALPIYEKGSPIRRDVTRAPATVTLPIPRSSIILTFSKTA